MTMQGMHLDGDVWVRIRYNEHREKSQCESDSSSVCSPSFGDQRQNESVSAYCLLTLHHFSDNSTGGNIGSDNI